MSPVRLNALTGSAPAEPTTPLGNACKAWWRMVLTSGQGPIKIAMFVEAGVGHWLSNPPVLPFRPLSRKLSRRVNQTRALFCLFIGALFPVVLCSKRDIHTWGCCALTKRFQTSERAVTVKAFIMKYCNAMIGACMLSVTNVVAFPRLMFDNPEKFAERDALSIEDVTSAIRKNLLEKRVLGDAAGFDPQAQLISTSGLNGFVPPGPNDLRGPCPGLNALANHNYLPHNGLATITQFIEATNDGCDSSSTAVCSIRS